MGMTITEYLFFAIIEKVRADLDTGDCVFFDLDVVMERYGLKPLFVELKSE